MHEAQRRTEMPRDLAGCQALIEQQVRTIQELEQQKEQLEQEKEELRLAFAELLQRAFRKRSERYLENPNQLRLDFGGTEDAADAAEGLAQAIEEAEILVPEHTRHKRARQPRQEKLPEHLPRYEVEAEVSDELKTCPEHGERKVIGYDAVETLEFERPQLHVRVTRYPKYACEGEPDCGVVSPERPTGIVEGDKYDTSVAAEIITAKYGYHLPLYRQQDVFGGSGWTPSRSTLLNILEGSAFVIRPLAEYLKQMVLTSPILGTDDTPVTLLLPKGIPRPIEGDPKSERIHEVFTGAVREGKPSVPARMWAYRSTTIPLCVFDFTVSRHRDGPDAFLAEYAGKLMADCYSGYQGIALRSDGRIERGACVAHARRKVFQARSGFSLEASWLLARFQQLYDIEDQAKAFSCEDRPGTDRRLVMRQSEAAAVWEAMGQWLESEPIRRVLPKSQFGQALGYLRNHWSPLQLYLTDGRMPIDNNDVEQLMKQVAIGRKNWLFIGSVAAGERAADFLTLVTSAVRNDLDVWAYVKDVLDRLLAGSTDYEALRPDIWKESHPEAVRQYRAEERRDRADRKQFRREQRRKSRPAAG